MNLLQTLGLSLPGTPQPAPGAPQPAPGATPEPGPGAPEPERGLAELKADTEKVVGQINLLVLGGLDDDAVRKGINAELDTLKAAVALAAKARDRLSAIKSYTAVLVTAKALLAKAEAARADILAKQKEAARDPQIAALRKRVDALGKRTARASEPPAAAFIGVRQQRVRDGLAAFAKWEAANDLKSCEIAFSQLGAALDAMDQTIRLYAEYRARFQAAKSGGVQQALAAKLVPPSLAALRDQAIAAKEATIEPLAQAGQLFKAGSAIDAWLNEAKTWGKSQAVYNNMRSGHPVEGAMKDLIGEPGGGAVFDAIVADLPSGTAAVTVETAIDARFGIEVTQFNHRKAKDAPKETYTDDSKELNPKDPQKGLKELYAVLRKVPVKDARTIEKIKDFVERPQHGRGGYYQSGILNDEIVLYAGRPGDASNTNPIGDAVVAPDTPDPRAVPLGGNTVQYFDFATLHEVGHGVDDDRSVMKKHMADAGWADHDTDEIAIKAAIKTGYDADYIESMMDSGSNAPPRKRPARPAHVRTDAEWEAARVRAEAWVTASRETASPWGNGAKAKANAIGGRVYHESYAGDWVSYKLAARTMGISSYQFRAPGEWFAELYAAFYSGKLNPSHPASTWLTALKAESEAG